MQERNQEKAAMTRDHQKAMETLRKENKKETDVRAFFFFLRVRAFWSLLADWGSKSVQ